MSKFITVLVISVIGFNTLADELKDESICIKDSLVQILKSDQSKKERQIVFNVTSDDLELKKLLRKLIPGSENKTFYVVDLDTLWDWDRANGMKYIYKILDLMNRNYDLESISPALKTKYLEESRFRCEGLN
jgi:3'-phosphoadenosine 5'-phosphosulfate sulfotransferase (PAPS reductase)/FAD synthetase